MSDHNKPTLDLFGQPVVYDEPVSDKDIEGGKILKHELYDWVRSIKETKVDLRKEHITVTRGKGENKQTLTIPPDPELKSLDMYSVIRALSQDVDVAPFANMMNIRSHLPKDMQYIFLMTVIPAHKSFPKWVKKTVDKNVKKLIDIGYDERDAEETALIFTDEQIALAIKEYKQAEKK